MDFGANLLPGIRFPQCHTPHGAGAPRGTPASPGAPLLTQASVLKAQPGAVPSPAPPQIRPLPGAAVGPRALHGGSPDGGEVQHEPWSVAQAATGAFWGVTAVLVVTL